MYVSGVPNGILSAKSTHLLAGGRGAPGPPTSKFASCRAFRAPCPFLGDRFSAERGERRRAERGDRLRRVFPNEREIAIRSGARLYLPRFLRRDSAPRAWRSLPAAKRTTFRQHFRTTRQTTLPPRTLHRRRAACAAYRFASRRPTRVVGSAFAPTGVPPARIISPIITSEILKEERPPE